MNDILDFSKLEAGQVSLRPMATPVSAFARSTLDLFVPQAHAKDLRLALDCTVSEDLLLFLDPDRIRQVLLNLVGNAVKFTDRGVVTLKVRYNKAKKRLRVEVRDTGQGIPTDRLDQLFKRFSQVDGAGARPGGTGLGLAICKGLVEAMGGEIGVSTRAGRGSTFHFSVPAAQAAACPGLTEGPFPPSADLFAGLRILVADDHPFNRELVGLVLAGAGADVCEAADGEMAAELAARGSYDVILMDLRMPNLDGLGAMRKIRQAAGPSALAPMLAFTADAEPEAVSRLRAAGFEGVVSKPVSPDALIDAVGQAWDLARARRLMPEAV